MVGLQRPSEQCLFRDATNPFLRVELEKWSRRIRVDDRKSLSAHTTRLDEHIREIFYTLGCSKSERTSNVRLSIALSFLKYLSRLWGILLPEWPCFEEEKKDGSEVSLFPVFFDITVYGI